MVKKNQFTHGLSHKGLNSSLTRDYKWFTISCPYHYEHLLLLTFFSLLLKLLCPME